MPMPHGSVAAKTEVEVAGECRDVFRGIAEFLCKAGAYAVDT